jgi:hypothetical protein
MIINRGAEFYRPLFDSYSTLIFGFPKLGEAWLVCAGSRADVLS